MFEPGTVLRLREPKSTEDKPFPYDRVEVVGTSPIQHATQGQTSPWAGPDAIGVILKPAGAEFAQNLDEPYGRINELYEIESFPTGDIAEPIKPQAQPRGLPTPEQQFRAVANDEEATRRRKRSQSLQSDGKTPEQVLREAAPVEPKVADPEEPVAEAPKRRTTRKPKDTSDE